jgi:hypothetical protein
MAVLMVGLLPLGAKPDTVGTFVGAVPPRNFAFGQMSIMLMLQSSTKQATVDARNDFGVGAGGAHRSHARKKLHES